MNVLGIILFLTSHKILSSFYNHKRLHLRSQYLHINDKKESNVTKTDCAMIPKKDIPNHIPLWKPPIC